MELSDPGVDVAETEEKGTEIIELEAVETELIEDGLLSTPVRDVVNCIGDTTSTPLRCVMETDDGQYEDVLDHPEAGMVFSSWEEADKFSRKHGKQRGFGVF
ncbi:uncharacterized protein LOC110711230 [Chenopodium quinoa]|uniref:uncharacterized protein LOC110711230 n=1 Tax=Chenopodium quinoa TaxID=63459 RepID=UPI000B798A68|nr:uncharacterized protein LOC110711230 [Chenopodium quinoa]